MRRSIAPLSIAIKGVGVKLGGGVKVGTGVLVGTGVKVTMVGVAVGVTVDPPTVIGVVVAVGGTGVSVAGKGMT